MCWWSWYLFGYPETPETYNKMYQHQITDADYEIMLQRWEAKEPRKGVPPSVRKQRERLMYLWGPDRNG